MEAVCTSETSVYYIALMMEAVCTSETSVYYIALMMEAKQYAPLKRRFTMYHPDDAGSVHL
jgi:hypothetical protein